MNNSLYKINSDLLELFNQVEEMEGEITPEIEEALTIKEGELQQKAVAYREVIEQKKSFLNRIKEEKARLQAIEKSTKSTIERLENNLLQAVQTFGDFEVGTVTFGTRKSTSVEVEDVNQLPDAFKKVKVTESADKVAIKKAIQSGVEVKGCKLVENKNLKIK